MMFMTILLKLNTKQVYKEKNTSQVLDKTIPAVKWWQIVKSITKFSKKTN